jgi:flagellin-like protein
MKRGVSPLISVVVLIVVAISLVLFTLPMIKKSTSETMDKASDTSERILSCKDIGYDIVKACRDGDVVKLEIENERTSVISNFIFQFKMEDNSIVISKSWSCEKNDLECENKDNIDEDNLACETCPYLVNLGSYHYQNPFWRYNLF